MNNSRIEKAYKDIDSKSKGFRPISDYIVEHYVTDPHEGTKLTKEDRDVISYVSSVDMAMGAEAKKVEYIIIGSLIGIVGTIIVMKIIKKFKKVKA